MDLLQREKAKTSSSSAPLTTEEYAEVLDSGFSSDVESKYKKMYEGGGYECICSFHEEGRGPKIQGTGSERQEIRRLNEKIGAFTSELKKTDNVTKFMYAEDLDSGFSSDVESKYKKMYEGGGYECICSFHEEGKGPKIQGTGIERQYYSQ